MATLAKSPTLRDFQVYIAQVEIERGFSEESVLQKCLLLGEELGELYKAIRRTAGIRVDSSSSVTSVREELADIFIYVIAISNRLDVDLEAAVRDKEDSNSRRKWT